MRKLLSFFVVLMLFFQSSCLFVLGWELFEEVDSSWIIENPSIFKGSDLILEEQNLWENLWDHENWSEKWWSDFFSWNNEVDGIFNQSESLAWEVLSWQNSIRGGDNENQALEDMGSPKLLITEVYFDGKDEWIEILNRWSEDFSWWLRLQSPEKSWNFNTSIPAGELVIFAKNASILSGITSQFLNISLTDTKAIELRLLFHEEEIDQFIVPETEVKKLDNAKTSFEKIEKNWSFRIIPTTAARTKNMQTGYFWNPWRAFDFDSWETEAPEPDDPQDPSSWNEVKLVITEAFFHQTNNWIEISNISERAFSGELSLSGISQQGKLFSYALQIPAQTSLVLAEKDIYFTWEFLKIETGDPYFLDWKKGLHLTLNYWNKLKDELIVHPEWTEFLMGKDSSFEKVFLNGQWLTTRTTLDRVKNMKVYLDSWETNQLIANPWVYFTEAENAKDISQPMHQQEENLEDEEIPVDCASFTDRYRLEIKELFFWNGIYQPFIELMRTDSPWKISHLRLTGTLLEKELLIEKNEENKELRDKNLTFVVWSWEFWNDKGIDSVFNPDFKFQNQSWYLILEGLVGQKRQVLDIVKLTKTESGKSAYHQGKMQGCARILDHFSDFSPWFDQKFLEFFQIDSEPKIEYIKIWGGGSCSCPTKEELCPFKKDDEKEVTETSVVEDKENPEELLNLENYQVKIEDIDYDPEGSDKDRESITMILTQGERLDLSLLTLNINGKKKKMKGVLKQGISQTFVGNFGFPNSSKTSDTILVQLKYKDSVLDSYYYKLNSKEKVKKEQISKEGIKVFSVLDGDTIRYRDEEWKLQSVRLLGVDAPESNTARYKKTECYGKEAKDYLTQRLKGQYVQLKFEEGQKNDRYGRLLAYVWLENRLINQELIAQGFAKEYTYKQTYSQQKNFKKAEQEAQSSSLGMRNDKYCPQQLEKDTELKANAEKLIIKITDIIYNPPGSDKNNEEIHLSIFDKSWTGKKINFENQFWLFVFDRQGTGLELNFEEIEGAGKFKDLSFLGEQEIINPMVLKGNFWLPNTKSSCIALVQKEHLFDIACYDISQKKEKKTESVSFSGIEIKILSLTPNPKGKDAGKEKIELVFNSENKEQEALFLGSWFYLLINGKTKKQLSGQLEAWVPKVFEGTFSFPNNNSCVAIKHGDQIFDTFCYGKTKDGVSYTATNQILTDFDTEELAMIKAVKLVKEGNKLCINYRNQTFACRNIPKSRSEQEKQRKQSAQAWESAFLGLENLLKTEYRPWYEQSSVSEYFQLAKTMKSDLKNHIFTTEIRKKNYQRKDFPKIFAKKGHYSINDFGQSILEQVFPEEIITFYLKKKEIWMQGLDDEF